MKAILEFNLPEDHEDFTLANKAVDYAGALNEYANWLRSICKYGEPTKEQEECYTKLFEIFGERNIDPLG